MNQTNRVEKLEEALNPQEEVWVTRINHEEERAAIERHERQTGRHLNASNVNWIDLRIWNVGTEQEFQP